MLVTFFAAVDGKVGAFGVDGKHPVKLFFSKSCNRGFNQFDNLHGYNDIYFAKAFLVLQITFNIGYLLTSAVRYTLTHSCNVAYYFICRSFIS